MNEQCYSCDGLRSENKFKAWAIGIFVVLLITSMGSCLAASGQANNAKMDLVSANHQIAELKAATAENLGAATMAPNGSYRVEACSLHLRACIMTPLGEKGGGARFYSLADVPGGAAEKSFAVEGGKVVGVMDPFR